MAKPTRFTRSSGSSLLGAARTAVAISTEASAGRSANELRRIIWSRAGARRKLQARRIGADLAIGFMGEGSRRILHDVQ